jgi:hypothetical protein
MNHWSGRNYQTRHRRLSSIDLAGLVYSRSSRSGVVIINWATVAAGKLGVLVAGAREKQRHLERCLAAVL